MKICLCCKQNEIKHTFSFSCRWCCGYLQQRYGIDVNGYIIYFKMMHNKKIHVKDCSCKSLREIHNQFMYTLRVTDKLLAELLEIILSLNVFAVNWENAFNLRSNIYDGATTRILN